MGDGLFATFGAATQAVQAAVDAQLRLAAWEWQSRSIVRVRMGVHLGSAIMTPTGYAGLDVHRAARVCAAAHGGQVLLSEPAAAHCSDPVMPNIAVRDLGLHLLKDLQEPEHLFQAVAPGLVSDFPPPRSARVRPHNLPSEITDFVGRETELEAVKRLLRVGRLVTLTGPGGTGKTRLALKVAGHLLADFEDGVNLVSLANVHAPEMVIAAIAHVLGVRADGDRPLLDLVDDHLATKTMVLVLDNFEHVLGAASEVTRLLQASPGLKVLVTSRAILHVSGEQVFEVSPLPVPDLREAQNVRQLAASGAVDLFVRRAKAADPNFSLSPANAQAVAEIVSRLEGLPLALELAAARIRLFPPAVLARRLAQPFKVLSGGPAGGLAHHRTLRDAIAWSYGLLEPAERAVFRRLAVFVGGFTLEAAEAVAAGPPVVDILDAISSLLDQSLMRSHALLGEARYVMLETIREFAAEELEAAGERRQAQEHHAAVMLALADDLEPHLTGANEPLSVERLTSDQANIEAALRYCHDSGNVDTGLRIAGAIWRFWHATGQLGEGRLWLEVLLACPASLSVRAKGLLGLAGLAYWQADYQKAQTSYEEALSIYRALGDRRGEAETLFGMSTTLSWNGDPVSGGRLADEALALFRTLGAQEKVGMVLMAQGFSRWMEGDLDGARPLWEASLAIAREAGDHVEAATKGLALASISHRQGQQKEALDLAVRALEELVGMKNVTFTIMALDWIAALSADRAPEPAVRLAGCAARLRATLGGGMRPEACGLESARGVAHRALDETTLELRWREGSDMGLQKGIDAAYELARCLVEDAPTAVLVSA